MRTRRPAHLFALLVSVAILAVGGTACSSDDDGDGPSATPASATGDEVTPASDETGNDGAGGGNDSERPFGVDQETLAYAVSSATGAASYDVDGNTIRLRYDEGSKEDVAASIHCSVALEMKAPEDRIEMTYPDGEFECVDE